VVGTEWFTLIDQSVTGRFFQLLNGERSNSGLFNVADRPYRDMVDEVATAPSRDLRCLAQGKAPFAIDDPRFTGAGGKAPPSKHLQAGHALGAVTIDGSVKNWPGRPPERIGSDRLVQGKDGKGFEAAVKLCWDETNLYVLAKVSDPTPLMNRASGKRSVERRWPRAVHRRREARAAGRAAAQRPSAAARGAPRRDRQPAIPGSWSMPPPSRTIA
jgi:hypothetical protein